MVLGGCRSFLLLVTTGICNIHTHKALKIRAGLYNYKSRQQFTGFYARFRRLLSLLHEQRDVEMMFIRAKLY